MLAHGMEISTVPYLWTAMFGKSIRYAGKGLPKAAVAFVLVEVSWDREATATSLAVAPPRQPLLPFLALEGFGVSSDTRGVQGQRVTAVVSGGGPA